MKNVLMEMKDKIMPLLIKLPCLNRIQVHSIIEAERNKESQTINFLKKEMNRRASESERAIEEGEVKNFSQFNPTRFYSPDACIE